MKILFHLSMICYILIGSNEVKANDEKEVYRSERLSINQISDHVYEHVSYLDTEGYGKVACNGMIVTDNGEAVVFDTTTDDESSAELIDWITKTLYSKIVAIIPTHYHDDNLGGLEEFHKQGIPSYAFEKTIQITQVINVFQPQHSFENFLELAVGDQKIYAEFLGEGHTCDNIIGYFPLEDIMFGGCLVKAMGSGKGNLEEANVQDWPETVRKVKSKYPKTTKIIPGHGKSGGTELLDYTIDLFK